MSGWFRTSERFQDPTGATRLGEFAIALSDFPLGHLVDLGAGHGLFSLLAADLGWRVTAVDARNERFPMDPRVRWVVCDVREFDEYEPDSVVACLGLWYHLTLDDQLTLLRRIAPRPLILDTHVARSDLSEHPVFTGSLSEIVHKGQHSGRLFQEVSQDRPTASWGNSYSFWPTVQTLQRQLEDVGYDRLERVLPPVTSDREYLVARVLSDNMRSRLDELITKYNPLQQKPATPEPETPEPVTPEPVAASKAAGAGSLSSGRLSLGRRLRRQIHRRLPPRAVALLRR